MKPQTWPALIKRFVLPVVIAIGLTYAIQSLYVAWPKPAPDLTEINCQPDDLGSLSFTTVPDRGAPLVEYHLSDFIVDEWVVMSDTTNFVDLSLTYLALDCGVYRYRDASLARQVFHETCPEGNLEAVADSDYEICSWERPQGFDKLAFRRNEYLVLMAGDATPFPVADVDERLQKALRAEIYWSE